MLAIKIITTVTKAIAMGTPFLTVGFCFDDRIESKFVSEQLCGVFVLGSKGMYFPAFDFILESKRIGFPHR